jgi:Uma2 family endonuclease
MFLLNDLPKRLQADDPEEKRIVTGANWEKYEVFLTDLGDSLSYRIAYLDGVLEIVSPSRRHESRKTRIGDLLLIYFRETDKEYFPTSSTTFRKEERQVGGEPDESYRIDINKDCPDLAVEVVITGGGINRLELYHRLRVREVWFWQNNNFSIYHLREGNLSQFVSTSGYEQITHNELLPNLEINLLAEYLCNANPLTAAKEFRQRLQSQLNK